MDRPLPWWLRAIFLFVAPQALLFVVTFFRPELISLLEPWPASTLNIRFIASLYTSVGLGVLLCSMAHSFREVRIILLGIGVATGLLFVITLFRLGGLERFPLFWMLFYAIDPLLVIFSFWRLRGTDAAARGSDPMRSLWAITAVIFGSVGLLLLALPGVAILLWPWALTEPLAQLYSAFFLTIAIASTLAMREASWEGAERVALILALLAVLVLAVSILHFDHFKAGVGTLIWFALFGAEAVVFGGLLIYRRVQPIMKGAIQ
ncbi:MAG: hypothetical protein NVSMB27_07040 [Ktedonobacteraceae bacterium]